MNNNIQILYNNVNLFSGIAPTPFISFDQQFIDFNKDRNQVTQMTMEGQITGAYAGPLSYYELNKNLNLLISRLSSNYGSLVISENSETLFSGSNVIVDSISTEQDSWYGILPFTINLEIYETGLFPNFYGIVEPEENINFTEEDGFIVSLNHSVSARGIKTGNSNAIESAKNWVKTRTGNYGKIVPIFAKTGNGSNFLLNSVKETVDRFNGSYKWEADYIKSTFIESQANSILNYTIEMSSGIEDRVVTVSIDGSLRNNNVTGNIANNLRSGYFNYDFYNIANQSSLSVFKTNLNSNPISQSVREEYNNNVLNFNLAYNNDLSSNVNNDYTVDISTNPIKNITDVSLSANITAKYGDVNTRWQLVQDYYNNTFKAFNLANTEYKKEISSKNLLEIPITESITFNEYTAEINYNATWSDKKKAYSDDIISMNSSVTYTPSVKIHVPNTSITKAREHNIQNINCANRSVLELSVSATAKPSKNISVTIEQVNSELRRIKTIYGIFSKDFLLEQKNVDRNTSTKTYSVTERYSYEGTVI